MVAFRTARPERTLAFITDAEGVLWPQNYLPGQIENMREHYTAKNYARAGIAALVRLEEDCRALDYSLQLVMASNERTFLGVEVFAEWLRGTILEECFHIDWRLPVDERCGLMIRKGEAARRWHALNRPAATVMVDDDNTIYDDEQPFVHVNWRVGLAGPNIRETRRLYAAQINLPQLMVERRDPRAAPVQAYDDFTI